MLNKLTLSLLSGLFVFDASAQTTSQTYSNVQSDSHSSAYAQDSRGMIARSSSGLCWRTGYWLPTDATIGCDGEITPPIARPIAPDLLPSTTKYADAVPLALITPASRCDFTITLPADLAFSFGKAELTEHAINHLKRDYQNRVSRCSHVKSISITGHTDRIGSAAGNISLSEQRARMVANVLDPISNSALISVAGIGDAQSITSCPENLSRSKLVTCLAADRRATVEVYGDAK